MNTEKIKNTLMLYWELLRARNGLITFFGTFVGASFMYMTGSGVPIAPVFTAGFAAFLIAGAGNALNDYFDYEIDKVNKPNRPLPSGRISKSDTFMLSTALFLLGLGFSKHVNQYCLILAIINATILIIYARYSKKLLFISNLCISYLVASIFLFGVSATLQGELNLEQLDQIKLVAVITACSFLITLSREIIKDIEDIKGDEEQYSLTLPIKIGVKRSRNIATFFTALAIFASISPLLMGIPTFNIYVYGILIVIADLIFLTTTFLNP